ncbi:hypothetical protein [Gemmatimonas sp.]|uniref:hypothetical protein n=1 Tax=Gemmatimonas sp. TaxID=1962908 RepID=UPI003983CB21
MSNVELCGRCDGLVFCHCNAPPRRRQVPYYTQTATGFERNAALAGGPCKLLFLHVYVDADAGAPLYVLVTTLVGEGASRETIALTSPSIAVGTSYTFPLPACGIPFVDGIVGVQSSTTGDALTMPSGEFVRITAVIEVDC